MLKNDDNITFYDKIALEKFKELATMIGMDTWAGMEVVFPFIEDKKVIVELGAGYGRVIDYLLKNNFQEEIIAIDRISWLVEHLKKKYSNQKVSVFQQDIKDLHIPKKADAVLWMWSGILELSPKEQLKSIQNIYHTLSENGILIIETPYKELRCVGEFQTKKVIHFEADWGSIDAYLSDFQEIENFAKKANFQSLDFKTYKTSKGIERIIYFLKK